MTTTMTYAINNSTAGAQALQLLQAQQAFGARRGQEASFENPAAAPVDEVILSDGRTIQGQEQAAVSTEASPQEMAEFLEINQIAQQVGYVGLTEMDIQRAMMTGESLLTDHRA